MVHRQSIRHVQTTARLYMRQPNFYMRISILSILSAGTTYTTYDSGPTIQLGYGWYFFADTLKFDRPLLFMVWVRVCSMT